MSDFTQPPTVVDQQASTSVIPLFTEVVLDDGAIQAARLALLAEIVAEQFSNPGPAPADGGGRLVLTMAAGHAECVAHLARVAADWNEPGVRPLMAALLPAMCRAASWWGRSDAAEPV